MSVSLPRLRHVSRLALWAINGLALVLLLVTGVFIFVEGRWAQGTALPPEAAFRDGTIGTELMPLAVARVLPGLAPQHFRPAGFAAGDWVAQFGFIPNPADPDGLPVGFVRSHRRPQTGAPSPVTFVGFSCALCHTSEIRTEDGGPATIVTGTGSVSLNLFAWLDAFQATLLEREALPAGTPFDPKDPPDYRIGAADIATASRNLTGEDLSPVETLMVRLWLRQIRGQLEAGLPRFDEPVGFGRSRDEDVSPTGPTRTLAFRTLIRTVLERPGNGLAIHTKIATIYSQEWRPRAQFDGSIANLDARSALAAFAAGATVTNLANPEVAENIRQASAYTTTLRAPAFDTVFPGAGDDPAKVAAGRAVYRAHCFACHGDKAAEGWERGPRTGTVIPVAEIGTDAGRVDFRHYGELAGRMHAIFDNGHPFAFRRDEIFPLPGEEDDVAGRGYVAGPIDGAWARAPYLHNASVLTLAELVNLAPRRDVFFRGRNLYDPEAVGFASPPAADAERYFRFDTGEPGNANAGHDYPWAWGDPARSPDDLEALLAYLRTL